jgi:DNA-binding beta-propeller fold protein YncE
VAAPKPASPSTIPTLTLKSAWATSPDVQKLGDSNFLTLDGNQTVYVTDAAKPGVAIFDRVGNFVRRSDLPGDAQLPTGIGVDGTGNVYVAEFGKSRIVKFDPTGRVIRTWPTLPDGPTGVATDAEGHVFVAAHRLHDRYVQKFDSDGKLLAEFGTTGTGDGQFLVDDRHLGPEQIAIGRSGHVYVTDSGASRVIEFDNAGAFVRNYLADPESSPRPLVGVAVDGAGNVYATAGGPVIKWMPDGRIAGHLELPRASSRWKPSLAASSNGDLWLAEVGARSASGDPVAIVHRLMPDT